MTLELRGCEICSVIIPVDRSRPEEVRYVCDNCRTGHESVTGPSGRLAPAGDRPELAATQSVARPLVRTAPSTESVVAPPSRLEAARAARRVASLLAVAVVLPVFLGVPVLLSELGGKGFEESSGDRIAWFGDGAAKGARRISELIIGTLPEGDEPIPSPAAEPFLEKPLRPR